MTGASGLLDLYGLTHTEIGGYTTILGFVGCYLIWFLQTPILLLMPDVNTRLIKSKQHTVWRSQAVAYAHGILVGTPATYFVLKHLDSLHGLGMTSVQMHSDGVTEDTLLPAVIIGLSNGYMIYDLISMIQLRTYLGMYYAVHWHHVIAIVCFSAALLIEDSGILTALVMMLACELNNSFLLLCKLLRLYGFDAATATVSRLVDLIWIVTCVTLRLKLHFDVGTTIVQYKDANLERFGGLFWLAIVGTWLVFLTDVVFTGQFIASRLSIYFGINSAFNKKVL